MGFWRFPALLGLVMVLFAPALDVSANDQRPLSERIDALVRDLGSEQFATRERASRELVELGIVTQDALKRAVAAPDAEVRMRARAILETVSESDFQQRLEAFSADYDGRQHRTLPAWEPFAATFGASRVSRELFVEMQRAEPEMLASLATGPQPASEILARRAQQVLNGESDVNMGIGSLASFLFLATADEVKVDEHGCLQLLPYVVQLSYQRHHKSPMWSPVLKKMIGRWLVKDVTPTTAFQNLLMASQLELKPESLAVASRILTTDTMQPNAKQISILVVGRYGDRSHMPMIEKLLADKSRCELSPNGPTGPGPTSGKQPELQIRDLALAVLVQLTGQDLRKYGGASPQAYGPTGFQMRALTFADEAAREAAHKQWTEWRAAHPES